METASKVLSLEIDSLALDGVPHTPNLSGEFSDGEQLGSETRISTPKSKSPARVPPTSESLTEKRQSLTTCNGNPSVPSNPLLDTNGVTCGECMERFNNLQKYMEHSCSGSLNNTVKPEEDYLYDNSDENELSDIENFEGKIVYQPDGSAYLIDQVGESDDEIAPSIPKSLEGLGLRYNSHTNQLTVQPPIVNALHIPCTPTFMNMSNMSQFGMNISENNTTPIMQSYRVYDVRTGNKKKEGDSKENELEKPAEKSLIFDSSKPILMCFLCKLSFGFAKSFVGHAANEHKLSLNEKEKNIMARKNQSAIIQGLGKEKEPLLSFLEPQPVKTQATSSSSYTTNGQSYYQQLLSSSQPNVSYIYPVSVPASTNTSLVTTSTAHIEGNSLSVEISPKQHGHNSSSCQNEDSRDSVAPKEQNLPKNISQKERNVNHLSADYEDDEMSPSSGVMENNEGTLSSKAESLIDFKNLSVSNTKETPEDTSAAKEAPEVSKTKSPTLEEKLSSSSRSSSNKDLASEHSTSTCIDYKRSTAKDTEDSPKCNAGEVEEDDQLNTDKHHSLRHSLSKELAVYNTSDHTHHHHHHHDHSNRVSSSVECPKCDMVLGSSRSLGGHMTMMHSRNSCKTLKCPKCNWHYKYQQTLEAHMKEKHPEAETKCVYCHSNQSHPRLARGETYTCGYKPFRCEICNYSTTTKGNLSIHMQSDKHLNNLQELQSGSAVSAATASVVSTGSTEHLFSQSKAGESTASKPKPKPTWRCEVCEYETNVARNLRIHMTSEKHMHNMLAVQHNVTQMQHDLQMNLGNFQADEGMYRLMAQNMVPISIATDAHIDPHAVMGEYPYDQAMYAAAMAGQITPEMMEVEATMGDDQPPVDEDPSKNEPLKMFQCSVCNKFCNDDLDVLYDHIHQDRSVPTDSSWKIHIGDVIRCNLCNYSTQLKANFQLHCKTDKHIQKLQLVNHIKEGGSQNEWRLKYMNVSNPTQVKCNACDYYTYSVEKLRAHVANYRHETSLKLFRHLQQINITINSESKYYHCNICNYSTKAKLSLIQHVRSMKHLKTEEGFERQKTEKEDSTAASHSGVNEGVLDLSKKDKSSEGSNEEKKSPSSSQSHSSPKKPSSDSAGTDGSHMRTTTTQIYTCPYCKYSSIDQDRIRAHVLSQHSVKPQAVLRCPLCQDMCTNKINLEIHLVQVHSVSRECLQRLMVGVEQSEWLVSTGNPPSASPTSLLSPGASQSQGLDSPTCQSPGSSMFASKIEESSDANQGSDVESGDQYRCQKCHQVFQQLDGLYKHQNEVCPLKEQETPGGPGFLCWKKGCNQYFKTSAALQMHFKEIHAKRPQLPVSERHVYKYRCNQCSLAFKTLEKLQVHSQYHMIRAATKCTICDRSFRSLSALRKHMETNHLELPASDVAQYFSLANNASGYMNLPSSTSQEAAVMIANSMGIPVSLASGSVFAQQTASEMSMQALTPDALDEKSQDSLSSDTMLEDEGSQAMDLSSEQDCDAENGPDDDALQDGPQPSEETYHDPTRKYKCHRCKVGFTKQSELSNHHKTLQHRRGCKAAYTMDKYLDPNRPYKCETCKESFTQKNILLVHYNSVSHLHKLKRSLNVNENSSSEPAPSNDKKPYKCNICKVAYSQGSTLDIHMRSVLHQTRAAKLDAWELGGLQHIGQVPDITCSIASASEHQQQQITSSLQQQLLAAAAADATQQLVQAQIAQNTDAANTAAANAVAAVALTQQLMDPNTLALFQQQMLSSGFANGMYCCSRCNSIFMSQETLIQHQQTQCYLSDTATAAQFSTQQKTYMTYTPRPSYAIMKSYLESYGFDLVQQFNESAQGLPPNVDPKDKFKCDYCDKEFSSIWVFKAHAEQVHKSFLPTKMIHKFAESYRDEYDKLQEEKNNLVTSVLETSAPGTPSDTGAVSAQQVSTSQASQSQQAATPQAQVVPTQLDIIPSAATASATTSVMPPPAVPSPSTQMMIQNSLPMQLQTMQNISYIDPTAYMQKSPKRARTRITDEQLKILRAHFDINNSPSEDQICEMSEKSGLPHKVIKHWFRNTLFKERQRNKDSPYNFNNPPSTALPPETSTEKKGDTETVTSESSASSVGSEPIGTPQPISLAEPQISAKLEPSAINESTVERSPISPTIMTDTTTIVSSVAETSIVPSPTSSIPISSTSMHMPPTSDTPPPQSSSSMTMTSCSSGSSKRAGRTRFTDYQIKMLQEFFENNAYPKDDDLEQLSKMLNLSPRVIVVWFQNARQKARKMFENQPQPEADTDNSGTRYRRTPGLNYQCNKCLLVFQRFFELIKHQKQHCYKDDDSSNNSYADSSTPTSPTTPTSSHAETPIPSKSEEKKSDIKSEPGQPPQVHYQCDKCELVFPQFEQWHEHQQVHFMQPFRSYMPQHASPFNMMYMPFDGSSMNGLTAEQYFGAFSTPKSETSPTGKRKLSETDDASNASETQSNADQDHQHRDKRLRTTISPQQLEILYQKYQEDSNPTRRMLDMIARQVGLKKRVVQVWFQNTRARERKGQFRLSAPNHLHKKCPFCRAIFKAKSALEAHIKARHWDQLVNGKPLEALMKQSDVIDYAELAAEESSSKLYEEFMKAESVDEGGEGEKALNLSSSSSKSDDKSAKMRRAPEDCIVISDSQDDSSQDAEEGSKDLIENNPEDFDSSACSSVGTGFSNEERHRDMEGDDDEEESVNDTDSICMSETTSYTYSYNIGPDDSNSGITDSNLTDAEQRKQARECGKRFRTQMNQLQLKVLKCCFTDYRTPTMHECELLGNDIGLPKRVVQVWFQNARAKEKKSKISIAKQFGLIGTNFDGPRDSCKLCGVQYSAKLSIRDHVFTETHIHNVKKYVSGQMEKDTSDSSSSVSQLLQHSDPIEAQRALAASYLPNHQAALLSQGHMSGLSAAQLQSVQAQAMSAFLGQTTAETSTSSTKEEVSVKEEKKESAEASTSSSSTSQNAAALAAASQSNFLPSMNSAEAAYMSYFFGGMAPYYAQAPFVYPLYSPNQTAAFFPYDPSMQMGFQSHLFPSQHQSPHSATTAFSPTIGKAEKGSSSSKKKDRTSKSSSTSTSTQESSTDSKGESSSSAAVHFNKASTSDHSISQLKSKSETKADKFS
uniref:LOW QUALITY PROTEIN: zinc finger homeobox protein 3-like n=1 Tax=Saccoglossus kowalevskii TaxID=10224 RepID=A0ABM0MY93_SACKO|nr:PREDICTED: LOW QUALITY PROTEIN: zinc finger homeobox protein 3-like [Saccoglossus kowalevskii]